MRHIVEFLTDKHQQVKYTEFPKTKTELIKIIAKSLSEGITNLNFIDTSEITDMGELFPSVSRLYNDMIEVKELDINHWILTNVKNARRMFYNLPNLKKLGCERLNVKNIQDFEEMFSGCESLDVDISKWQMDNALDIENMFNGCKSLKVNLNKLKVNNNVKYFKNTFKNTQYEDNLPKWYKRLK